jgi:putative cell wall-binding protein
MIRAHVGRKAAVAASMIVAMTALGLPAQADDESEAESQGLEVEIRPAIAAVDGLVTVAAEYEVDDEDTDDEDTDDSSTDDSSTDDSSTDDSSTDDSSTDDSSTDDSSTDDSDTATAGSDDGSTDDGAPLAVDFVVDFGDGTGPQPMQLDEADEEEAEAFAQHAYTAAGEYTVTVTATPAGGTAVTVTAVVKVGSGAARLSGDDRYNTAERLSREDFPTDGSATAVLLARADSFADALSAASVAVLEDAPVLLTASADLPPSVLEELQRALGQGGTVYLLGGEAAISPAVAEAIAAAGYQVVRIAGEDRIATSLQLAQFLVDAGVEVDEVVLASATNFPDALAGAAYAASSESPVLLTAPDMLDPRVRDFLVSLGDGVEVHVAGGTAAVSDAVLAEVASLGVEVERLSGEDRYETAVEIAEALFPAPSAVALATGLNFPDALAGAAAAGRRDAPVLLVGATLPDSVREYLEENASTITAVYVLGGEGVVSPEVMTEVRAILGL